MDNSYKNNHTQLPDFGDTAFTDPDDITSQRNDTHPQTDTNVDPDEAYHEGLGEATSIN